MTTKPSLKKNAVLNAIRTVMSLLFPLITFPYSSRILAPDGIGSVNFARSVASYFGMIAALGISMYGIREAAKIRDDQKKLNQFSCELFCINMISTLIAYILFFLAVACIPKLYEYRWLLCICSSAILFETLGINWLYTAEEDFFYISLRSVLFQAFSVLVLFFLVKTKEDILQYAFVTVIASVGSNILNFFHAKKYIRFKTSEPLHLKRHIKPILVFFGMNVTASIYTMLDTVMLGFLTNDYQVGLYTASTKLNKMVLAVVTSVSTVLLPRLSYYAGEDNKEKFNDLVYKSVDLLFLISIPCAIGLSLVTEPAILLFSGIEYKAAIPIMRTMNPIIVIIGLSALLGIQILVPMNKQKYTLISEIIGAVSNFTLNIILIPRYSAMGAAIATVIAETLVTSTQIFFARKYFDLKKFLRPFLRYIANACTMGGCVYLIGTHITNIPAKLFVPALCGAIVYFILLVLEKNSFVMQYLRAIRIKLTSLSCCLF